MEKVFEEISLINDKEEEDVIVTSWFLLAPIFLCLTGVMIVNLYSKREQLKKAKSQSRSESQSQSQSELLTSINFALLSMSMSVPFYFSVMFMNNNFVFNWDFASFDYQYSDISTALIQCFWTLGHISFYISFLFQMLSLIDSNSADAESNLANIKMKYFLKRLIYVAMCVLVLLMVCYYAADISQNHMKEIGAFSVSDSSSPDFYFGMYLAHQGSYFAVEFIFCLTCVEISYFLCMLYIYSCTRSFRGSDSAGRAFITINGLVLLIVSCTAEFFHLGLIATTHKYRWLACVCDVFSDDIAIYLLYVFHYSLYHKLCFSCHSVVACLCFGKHQHTSYGQFILLKHGREQERERELDENENENDSSSQLL